MSRGLLQAAVALCALTSLSVSAVGQPEPLYSVVWGEQGITVQVESHGCTRRGDFVWQVPSVAAGASAELSTLQLQRKQADRCRRKPYLQGVFFAWSQLPAAVAESIQAGKPFALANPLQLVPAQLHP